MRQETQHALIGAALTAALYLASQYLGPLAIMLGLAAAFPAVYLHMRYGMQAALITIGSATLALAMLLPMSLVAGYLLQYALISFVLPLALRQGQSWDRASAAAALSVVAVGTPLLLGYASSQGLGTAEVVRAEAQRNFEHTLRLLEQGEMSLTERQQLEHSLAELADVMARIYPGPAIVMGLALALLLVLLLSRFNRGHYQLAGPRFSCWKAPEQLVWVVIAAGFALLVPANGVRTLALNLLVVLVPVYFLQGLAVVTYFLSRRRLPHFVRSLAYVAIFIISPLPMLVTGVGLFDLWVDFRKPKINKTS